ncbi:MAG: dihydropteroate synthase [Candidatus Marinimicrobia bacterium]|nr:dihydropteroate synthase [Candidatus Neomarinimicrobiota bacterium]
MVDACIYFTPRAFLKGRTALDAIAQGMAWPLNIGGSSFAFPIIEISNVKNRAVQSVIVSRSSFEQKCDYVEEHFRSQLVSQLALFERPNPTFAGFEFSQPIIMGIVNVTPDSFSDGGQYNNTEAAISHGLKLSESGASIIDVGGESTRPGATPVKSEIEIARVVPVIQGLATRGICVSIDTRHAPVMAAAIDAGATIVNDVTALTGDTNSLRIVSDAGVPVILMHMQGQPQTMQEKPKYAWAPGDVFNFLESRVAACVDAGVSEQNIAVDPGVGFGKSLPHNVDIMDYLSLFHGLGCTIVFGASRKSFIAKLSNGEAADNRLPGSLAAALYAAAQGAQILRVHDVAETCQALKIVQRLAAIDD